MGPGHLVPSSYSHWYVRDTHLAVWLCCSATRWERRVIYRDWVACVFKSRMYLDELPGTGCLFSEIEQVRLVSAEAERPHNPSCGGGSSRTMTQMWLHKADSTYSRARPKNSWTHIIPHVDQLKIATCWHCRRAPCDGFSKTPLLFREVWEEELPSWTWNSIHGFCWKTSEMFWVGKLCPGLAGYTRSGRGGIVSRDGRRFEASGVRFSSAAPAVVLGLLLPDPDSTMNERLELERWKVHLTEHCEILFWHLGIAILFLRSTFDGCAHFHIPLVDWNSPLKVITHKLQQSWGASNNAGTWEWKKFECKKQLLFFLPRSKQLRLCQVFAPGKL